MGERQILDAVLKKEQPGFAKDLDGEHEKMGPATTPEHLV